MCRLVEVPIKTAETNGVVDPVKRQVDACELNTVVGPQSELPRQITRQCDRWPVN